MFASFILSLRSAGVPASITEYLTLLGAMKAGAAAFNVEDFYFLSRAALIKDEVLNNSSAANARCLATRRRRAALWRRAAAAARPLSHILSQRSIPNRSER